MPANGLCTFKLTELLLTHELKLVCPLCAVKEGQITYSLSPVYHQCTCEFLVCRAKAGSKWRPISRRPEFPNPSKYVVCRYFAESSGCTQHRNRCSFARSEEEAVVWNFEKRQGLNHTSLVKLVAQGDTGSAHLDKPESLDDLLATLDLKAACSVCSVRQKEITYTVTSVRHQCRRNLLFAKVNGSKEWRPVSKRPTYMRCGQNVLYQVCRYFVEGSGCKRHGQECTFARSVEEATVWNFIKDLKMDESKFIRLITESQPVLPQRENAAEDILQEFSGEFLELCEDCFLGTPQKISSKKWNNTCSGDTPHAWNPVLVHHLAESHGKEIYSPVRPLPPDCKFEYCSHVREGRPCWHEAGQCQAAHSEVEMAVWRAEGRGLSVRPNLVQLSQQTEPRPATFYCRACLLGLSSPESFYRHCDSQEHAQVISDDTSTRWRGRPPPHNRRDELWLCDRPATCEYGTNCVRAHSVEELKEWLMQVKEEKEIRHNMEARGLMSYSERLLEAFRNSSNEENVMSEQVDDVSVTCDKELSVETEQTSATLQWNFKVNTERQLVHVALLKQEPGALFSLGEISPEPCSYSSGKGFQTSDATYSITVSFESANPGLYEQWMVLDFDMRPVLLRRLKVRVGQQSSDSTEEPTVSCGRPSQSAERWHRENRVIIPCLFRREEQEELMKEYKPPQISFVYKPTDDRKTPLNPENYKERMHNFLYNEERAEDQVVSRLNVCGEVEMSATLPTKFGIETASQGELFCSVFIPINLTPDTPEGFVLKRSIQSTLIAPLSSGNQNSKVYEADILQNATAENKMHLRLSRRCCSDLALRSDEVRQMEVQFQLNRFKFCMMHKAVDLLPDMQRVLPDLENCAVPVKEVQHDRMNAKQLSAVGFVTGDSDVRKSVAPLLIYGPFGTGKTFTLATAAIELTKQPQNKVLICTHTNSSADLYVRDHFHPFITSGQNGIKPIRIKATSQGTLHYTDHVTLKYCLYSKEEERFLPPTKADLDHHKVVITTAVMARHFHDLKLPVGYFTHILIDEASQMLECEALMPLGLAGPNTRVVLAGDHMQMGPKLFSVEDHQRSNHTLLNRLFHYYLGQKCDAAQKSRIIFNENYRSTKEIVEFVSTHFYIGSNAAIKAAGNVPAHPNGHALKFHHVRGECQLDTLSMSWFNNEEVSKVTEAVQDILQHWPHTWGTKSQTSICVLSEGCQVRKIRAALSRKNLSQVSVESFATVQGKQFRAVIMTAVQTRESLKSSHLDGLELFDDARVFNTAMTRAQSQVVVIGDAGALCCFGKCSRIWKSYIEHCINNNSVEPKHLTKDFFERDVKEIVRFHKSEPVEESTLHTDEILQQLKDEYEQMEAQYISEEDSSEFEASVEHKTSYNKADVERDNLLELCKSQPNMYRRGQLIMESYDMGYVIPFDNPTKHISLKRRKNFGKSFNGDEVVVETSVSDGITQSKVVGITKSAESSRVFVCMLEDEDHCKPKPKTKEYNFIRKIMIPITKSAPKICILLHKKDRRNLPVWEHTDREWRIASYQSLDENLRQNHVFMVQVISWKEKCVFPLGKVIEILPIGESVNGGLRILNEEFKVAPAPSESRKKRDFSWTPEDKKHRQDLRNIITFTVDPAKAKDLDDAISIRDIGDHYELGIHIADVASFVNPDGALDENAKSCGATYYRPGKEPIHMFPEDLSTEHWSLLSGCDRKVVSLMLKVTKETNQIIEPPAFQLSLINSNRKLSYEEAEEIICEKYGQNLTFDTVEDCVAVAYCFAKACRKARLVDWAYSQPDDDRLPGKRRAHLMIEELSVLFNARVSEILISSQKTMDCTPLRCQAAPDPERVEELKKKYGELIPLSFQMRHRVEHDEQVPTRRTFCILTKVWNDIQAAARAENDIDKIIDLVAADDIHPQLLPAVSQFRKCLGKAYVIRSNSSPKAMIGHYSLSLESYTQASSPIRRYMDIVLQRLLHTVICNTPVQYSPKEIDILCNQFEQSSKTAKEYEQKAEMITYAVSMKKQNALKLAFIVSAEPERESFRVSFPFNKNIFPDSVPVMYRDLQLEDQPLYDPEKKCTKLKWRRRIYSASTMQIHQEVQRSPDFGPCTEIPLSTWQAIGEAIDKENWDDAKAIILSADTKQLRKERKIERVESDTSTEEHYVELDVELQPGDTLQVQMTSEIKRGYLTPTVQLICIKPKFEVCVDHVHSPITCFSKYANDPSKTRYCDIYEYEHIWKPLCEMESATTAVDESDSVIIEDLVVNFCHKQENILIGTFNLPHTYIKEWAIGFNLAQCFLCIRKRALKLTSAVDQSAEVDPSSFTWVAHGVTKSAEDVMNLKKKECKVEFYISHLPMETIPDCVFQKDTRFTVEIIPKLLPDIRKENAVVNIGSSNDLVKKIALGLYIQREALHYSVPRGQLMRKEPPKGMPKLNKSQIDAVEKALNNNFTLIQGPPGTGKTVVGVNIVYWFFEMNSRGPRNFFDPKDLDKKEVILYCGPSNKSVDVVAEYLLRFGNNLKPLRVYGQQVEMLDYPYPDCNVQFSARSFRQEKSKPELRDITLHHRMRQDQNPDSAQIKEFDRRIQEEEELTTDEVDTYKNLLRNARKYELERHDIILCTCTVSSTPSLTKTVTARQILIDECAMATEPQALIPLVCNKPEKIVLIGDHKQLRPIVKNEHVRKLGMSKSLFERYFTVNKTRAVMLDIQYRMHEDICKFPSEEYYDGLLKTEVERKNSVLLINNKPRPIIFGDIRGQEISQVVSTAKGNENSKANLEERDTVVKIAKKLVENARVDQRSIVILSPYNAQVAEIRACLQKMKMKDITVTTITKSQGSEWRYVIISTVRSLPSKDIEKQPERSWLSRHVGFVGDPNQINVGITRAKEGLCIIGNQELLSCSRAWRSLFKHYTANGSVTNAENISVHRAPR